MHPKTGHPPGLRGRGLRAWGALAVAASGWLAAPAWARGNDCVFLSSRTLAIRFGTVDLMARASLRRSADAPSRDDLRAGDCARSQPMAVKVDLGNHPLGGARRMKLDQGNRYLRYTVEVRGLGGHGPGNRAYDDFELVATLEPADYANAVAGTYTDCLTLTVTP